MPDELRFGHELYALSPDGNPHSPLCAVSVQCAAVAAFCAASRDPVGILVGRGVAEDERWWHRRGRGRQQRTRGRGAYGDEGGQGRDGGGGDCNGESRGTPASARGERDGDERQQDDNDHEKQLVKREQNKEKDANSVDWRAQAKEEGQAGDEQETLGKVATHYVPCDKFGGAFSTRVNPVPPHIWGSFTHADTLTHLPSGAFASVAFDHSTWRYMALETAILQDWRRLLCPGGRVVFDAYVASVRVHPGPLGYEWGNPTHLLLPLKDAALVSDWITVAAGSSRGEPAGGGSGSPQLSDQQPDGKRQQQPRRSQPHNPLLRLASTGGDNGATWALRVRRVLPAPVAPSAAWDRHPFLDTLGRLYTDIFLAAGFQDVVLCSAPYPVETRGHVGAWFYARKKLASA